MLRAARDTGIQIYLGIFTVLWLAGRSRYLSAIFVSRFSALARSFAELVFNETITTPYFAPVNESFFQRMGFGGQGISASISDPSRALELKCQ